MGRLLSQVRSIPTVLGSTIAFDGRNVLVSIKELAQVKG